jgi:ferrous iron transport protein B
VSARPCVAFAGNPNTGKTTLWNRLTGRQGRVGNYPGITVELAQSELRLPDGAVVDAVDIPGAYSLVVRSEDERVAVSRLGCGSDQQPDLIVACVDATHLLRNLYLVLQLQELGQNVIVALTMIDELGDASVDADALAAKLDCPVVPVSAPKRRGLDALKQAIATRLAAPDRTPRLRWEPTPALSAELTRIQAALPASWHASPGHALWALQS